MAIAVLATLALGIPATPGAAAATTVFLLKGEQLQPLVRRGAPNSVPGAVRSVLGGPTRRERLAGITSALPRGTRLRRITIDRETGSAAIALTASTYPLRATDRRTSARPAVLAELAATAMTADRRIRHVRVTAGGSPLGTMSRAQLHVRHGSRSAAARESNARHTLRRQTSRGTAALQRKLAAQTFLPPSAVDGVYGYQTRQAVIAFQAWNHLARDGIAGPDTRRALATAAVPRPRDAGARHIEVYRSLGVALMVDAGGHVRRAVHVSTGAPSTPTPTGLYRVFRKEVRSWSVPFRSWLPYASYFNGGIAFHEYPDVPAVPASHGCVRVPAPDAVAVFRFATRGTRIAVY